MTVAARRSSSPSPAERARRPQRYVWRGQSPHEESSAPGTERERAAALTRAVAVAAIEVLAGARPAGQLARWAEPEIVDKLRRRAWLLQRRRELEPPEAPVHRVHQHSEVLSQRVCCVADGIYEAALVVRDASRSRAVVLRTEKQERSWRITVLEVG